MINLKAFLVSKQSYGHLNDCNQSKVTVQKTNQKIHFNFGQSINL